MGKNKSKKFREWIDEDFEVKKDSKRYDKRKAKIQEATGESTYFFLQLALLDLI